MSMDSSREQRLSAVESAVAEIRRRLGDRPAAVDWVTRFDGSSRDEPAFAEVIAHGRAFR